jgi:hypothetical protein
MIGLDFINKECVGCGVKFTCLEEDVEALLYCTDECEKNHSIFKIESEVEATSK